MKFNNYIRYRNKISMVKIKEIYNFDISVTVHHIYK